jgi:predicted nucleotidyltransferase
MKNKDVIIKMQFGSHVYGTNIPESDLDYKGVFLPDARDILLGRVKDAIVTSTKKDDTQKNITMDVDEEYYSYQKFLYFLMDGQTVAMDMFFTPEKFIEYKNPELIHIWDFLKENKTYFINKGMKVFVGYCQQQALKYGVKGNRLASAEKAVKFLQHYNGRNKLKDIPLIALVEAEHDEFITIAYMNDGLMYLSVCGRMVPFTATVKFAKEVYEKLIRQYGKRARQAASNEGHDWKALYHAVRIAHEAIELLMTGNITLPRPEADSLLKIRKGEVPYDDVAFMIDNGLKKLHEAQAKSALREIPDRSMADEFIINAYVNQIMKSFGGKK